MSLDPEVVSLTVRSSRAPYIKPLDRILAIGKFDFLVFDDKIRAEDATCYFPAVLAMTDVTSSLLAE